MTLDGPALFGGEQIKHIVKIMLDKGYTTANTDDQATEV
jgi:hypothetical protein